MKYLVVGLGNPGEEYVNTRHNAGRMSVEKLAKNVDAVPWKKDTGSNALLSSAKIGKHTALLALPETFMNNSGKAVGYLSRARGVVAERVIIVHDDLDLPLGTLKISFARGSAGHKGVESVERALKTTEYTRVRVGVSPHTPKGAIRKPDGKKKVITHVIGIFKKSEEGEEKKAVKRAAEAIEMILAEGRERAMNEFNQ